jgi:hypothetical protein
VAEYVVLFVSIDGARSIDDSVDAPSVATAAQLAGVMLGGPMFGERSAWQVAGVWRHDLEHLVAAHIKVDE